MMQYIREYWIKNKNKITEKKQEYENKNKEYLKSKKKEWSLKNKAKLSKQRRNRVRGYLKNNSQFKLKLYLRNRIREVLKEQKTIKSRKTFDLIGCQPKKLRSHIEKLFKPKMKWENYGSWHIDHIVPCSKFDLTDPAQQKICFNYKNLQPLWAKENIIKSNK
ncbi:hypothetical protein N9419_01830 [Candidatus Pelagibacter sp.]|nr:hypothetical protein [Candidatus Pelagibacter sp.]